MPSGAKKRKAAKKKKENQSDNHSNSSSTPTHSHGDEDMQHHDNRESDAGEVSSVQVEREFKIEDELDKKHGSVEHDEATKKSYDGSSSGSSGDSSSSDDESQDIKNRQAASDIVSVESVKVADSLSGKSVEAIHNSQIAEVGDSVVENIRATDSEKITVLGEQVEVDVHSPVAPYVVESTLKENEEKKLGSVEDKTCTSVSFVDAALQGKEEAIAQCAENTATTSDPKECATQENDDRLVSPYNAPRTTGDNGTEHMKDSVVTQPLPAPSPLPMQKTSWKSCCGLFEVFSGSGA